MIRIAAGVIGAAGAALMIGTFWLGDPITALGAVFGMGLMGIPVLLLTDMALKTEAEDKLQGGRAADRSFFVREIKELDAQHTRVVQEMSFAAGGMQQKLLMIEGKVSRMTDRPRDARGRMRPADIDHSA